MAFVQRYRKQRKTTILLFPGQIMIMADEYNGPEYGRPLNGAGVRKISCSATFDVTSGYKIATWNVRSLIAAGKSHNLVREMDRLKIAILGISEVRWIGSGSCTVDDHQIFYSGQEGPSNWNGVGFVITKDMNKYVKSVCNVSDRIILLQLSAKPVNVNFIQVYAPPSYSSEDEIEEFYADLKKVREKLCSQEITIIMGDWNAKIGEGKEDKIVGAFGLGDRNERGDRLLEFCKEANHCIMNTFFKLPKRRLYTWTAPGHNPTHIIRNQIDYITINARYRNSVKGVKTYPSADINSDHNILIADLKLKFKILKKQVATSKMDLEDFNKNKEKLTTELKRKFENIEIEDDIEQLWLHTKEAIHEVASTVKKQRPKKKHWMSDEILDLMEERRQYKNRDPEMYKTKNKEIRRKIREAQQKDLEFKCVEIETLEKKHDSFNMYKKVKELVQSVTRSGNDLVDEEGNLIIKEEDRIKTWENYIKELFEDHREVIETEDVSTGQNMNILELETAIKLSKNRKALGPDNIPVEVIKLLESMGKETLLILFNNIYNTGIIPEDWLKSTFVTLPKKQNAKSCKDYRTISLMSHVLKVFLRIIHSRLYLKIEEHIGETQFGFRNNLGTREALFGIQVLVQKCRDLGHPVFMCFIDFEKAFDKVRHNKLIEVLRKTGIHDKDLRIIKNLYFNQKANVRVGMSVSEEVEIKRGVRQGCILSPLLFNLYSEFIFKEALEGINCGIELKTEDSTITINNLRYADDTVLITKSHAELQLIVNRVIEACENYGLKLNAKKTKIMIVNKKPIRTPAIRAYNTELERTKSVTYLGTYIHEDWDPGREIKIRIEKARSTFFKMRKVFCCRSLKLDLRMRLVRCYIFSILLYGVESWTVTATLLKKIEAFEMWVYRRLLKVSWVDRVTNVEILQRLNKNTEVVRSIKTKKLEYLGPYITSS
uniref:Craniofacial development protein 2 n=1 Tax=Cacopsylla melanoneura TaxID=428564 RepID=A0A8D8SN59_9HEMI